MTHLLHAVAAFLLALVGYSAGAVLAASRRDARPAGWELPTAAAVALAAAVVGPDLLGGWSALPAAGGAGAGTGLVAGLASRLGRSAEADSSQDRLDARHVAGDGEGSGVRRFLLRVGTYQGRVTMGFLYFGLLTPFALVSRLTSSPLELDPGRATYWRKRPDEPSRAPSESLRRQA